MLVAATKIIPAREHSPQCIRRLYQSGASSVAQPTQYFLLISILSCFLLFILLLIYLTIFFSHLLTYLLLFYHLLARYYYFITLELSSIHYSSLIYLLLFFHLSSLFSRLSSLFSRLFLTDLLAMLEHIGYSLVRTPPPRLQRLPSPARLSHYRSAVLVAEPRLILAISSLARASPF